MGENKAKIIHLYLSLFIRNPIICIREIIYSTWLIWANYGAFSNSSMLVLIALAVFFVLRRMNSKSSVFALLIPLAANVISIAISTISNETRYMLPTFLLCAPLILNILCKIPREKLI